MKDMERPDQIMTFRQYSEIVNNGSYLAVYPNADTEIKILKIANALGIDVDPDKLHVTLMYSEIGVPDVPLKPQKTYNAVPVAFRLFGPEENVLVIELKSSDLKLRHSELREFGLQHSYDQFRPHVTLSDDWTGELPPAEFLTITDGQFVFEKETHEPIS